MFMKTAIVALTMVTNPVNAAVSIEEGAGESRVDLLSGVPYSNTLNCGECIASGFNFCWKTDIPGKILNNDNYPKKNDDFKLTEQRCCETNAAEDKANCPDFKKMKDDEKSLWSCSYSYKSSAYALLNCPFKRSSCGPNQKINFYQSNDDGAIHIQELSKGEACSYNVESVCGAPSFKADNSTGVEVYFTEWQQDQVQQATPVTGKPFDAQEVSRASPIQGMPSRNYEFKYEQGIEAEGSAVYGQYSKESSWKSWGNKVQDTESLIGRRYSTTDNECKLRNMLVSVVATGDDAQLLLEIQSNKFQAQYLKNASLAALISIGMALVLN